MSLRSVRYHRPHRSNKRSHRRPLEPGDDIPGRGSRSVDRRRNR